MTSHPPSLHRQILLGLLIGLVLGLASNWVANSMGADAVLWLEWVATNVADSIGKIFLRLMFMVVVPLVFAALSLAVVNLGDFRRLGRVGLRTLMFTGMLSLTAVVLGIGLVNLIRPGHSLTPEKQTVLREKYGDVDESKLDKATAATLANAKKAKSLRDTLLDLIPMNPLQEMVGAIDGSSPGNGLLAVMFFSLAFGMAITAAPDKCATLVGWLEGLFSVSMTVIGFAMRLAPYGAGCLVFSLTARLGFDILTTLFWFVLTVMLGLTLHQTLVYSIVVRVFGGRSPGSFFRDVSEAMLTAFGTSSSNATLPTALRVAEDDLKLPREVSNFVLTVGATGNQNGTALFEGIVVLFLAQLFGVELSLPQQVTVVLMSVLAGVGTAGVPGGSLPLIVVLLQSVGVPGSGIGVILGVDRLLDMCRTVLNVTGDLVVATCVARGEKLPNPSEP
jgi:DAACS family dicarboxylate/amino acid:cation (Na+ or H+) symporter